MVRYPETGSDAERLRRLEERVQTLERADRLTSASIGPGGLRVKGGAIAILDADGGEQLRLSTDGLTLRGLLRALGDIEVGEDGEVRTADFDGDLAVGDPGSEGWALGGSGVAAFSTLLLRDRILGPESLGVTWDGEGASATAFAVPSAATPVVTAQVDVPEWASEALVFCWANASIRNSSGAFDFGYVRAIIDGTGGGEMFTGFAAGEWSNLVATAQRTISGASLGATIDVAAQLRTQSAAWPSSAANILNLDAWVFFRS